jgi:hypothetical protein
MRSFSRSTSLRVEEIEQLFKNAVQCAKNAYATTGVHAPVWRRSYNPGNVGNVWAILG